MDSEAEIKKQFRRLAILHHPDKNMGSKKSEETFKLILCAYETLMDRDRRAIYDLKYKQYQSNNAKKSFSGSNYTQEQNRSQPRYREQQKSGHEKSKLNYGVWAVIILLAILYLYRSNKITTTGNKKADLQLQEQKPKNRPQSGELDFNK